MIVADAMYRFPVIVSPNLSCASALAIAQEQGTHFLLAVDGDELVGVLRACELRKASPSARVVRTARAPIISVTLTESIALAKRMLTLGGAGCLVVVDDDASLRGTLTREDLSRMGLLSRERGVDCCAACGDLDHLVFAGADQPALCCECIDRARFSDFAEPFELTTGCSG
jgi:signal-transduction protein with cAMP-binding, CBS, and nucleotidyltransferase domain